MFPAMLLLTIAYALRRDRRLLISVTAMTAVAAMNQLLVLQGGMGTANTGHLQESEQWLNIALSAVNVLNALFLAWTAWDICARDHIIAAKPAETDDVLFEISTAQKPTDHCLHIRRIDLILMAAVTAVYSIVAFVNLGACAAPQTSWIASADNEAIVFDLGDVHTYRMIYYGGICDSTFTVELSNDARHWTNPAYAKYNRNEIFRWIYFAPNAADEIASGGSADDVQMNFVSLDQSFPMQTSRYIRITAQSAGLTLSEFGFWDADGNLLSVSIADHTGADALTASDPNNLIDEQDTVAQTPSYFNSTYFDEIYHARTAYELKHGMSIYEWTHPPLGKVLMGMGIDLFGMTPFGWRFMGALIGVLMVPLMYLMAKQLTKDVRLSFLAMCLMALDSMHFTQTRIATIDSYAVFWIMLMYLFMIRYIQMDWRQVRTGRSLATLGLCGVTMGVAWATKWIGLYASVGLVLEADFGNHARGKSKGGRAARGLDVPVLRRLFRDHSGADLLFLLLSAAALRGRGGHRRDVYEEIRGTRDQPSAVHALLSCGARRRYALFPLAVVSMADHLVADVVLFRQRLCAGRNDFIDLVHGQSRRMVVGADRADRASDLCRPEPPRKARASDRADRLRFAVFAVGAGAQIDVHLSLFRQRAVHHPVHRADASGNRRKTPASCAIHRKRADRGGAGDVHRLLSAGIRHAGFAELCKAAPVV